jgi:hypothetical protein
MAPDRSPALRASDADREAVAQRLRAAHAAGQLDVNEIEERLTAAYAAKTLGDLEPLTADLGPAPPARPRRRSPLEPWREWAGVAVLLNVIWIITCIAAGELLFYWPMFPVGIWGATILVEQVFGVGKRPSRPGGSGQGPGPLRGPTQQPEPPDRPQLP